MREARLAWCLEHRDWTLEDWKNVIWTDETSVILLHRRGGYRIWRTKEESFVRSAIRERWKVEKQEAEKEVDELNIEIEPLARQNWELTSGFGRLGLRNKPGSKPTWRFTLKTGKLSRSKSRGGIDWYRYWKTILHPKLIPFAKECIVDRPGTVVQEDKAPSHSHHFQQRIFEISEVKRLIWPGNSPDLNMIEPCWFHLKRETTKKGAAKNRKDAIRAWQEA
ncbi:hypothetical protein N7516_001934 [Penicillium verrucosum]|uniref:uncharacterized protein n=1 Tax=Penicillium verrucosum TaxID=60171 RepID=UPI0025456923|nr:uncharacterized protein N7516_001934 [Penicillium verrucosum]KAJ5941766.1 hypothetical protein N7516_001934 [Penicillium verrucosum]